MKHAQSAEPRTVRSVCRYGDAQEEEIGKEVSHVHKLLCRLRHAGATRSDLVKMRDADLDIFSEFLARLREIPVNNRNALDAFPFNFINLDYEPGIRESVSKLSDGALANDAKLSIDCRLGIWPAESKDGDLVFGDMKVAIERPFSSCCLNERNYHSDSDYMGITKNSIHLNLAMASWFSEDGCGRIDIPFDVSPFFDGKWGDDCIFFLGTVWYIWNSDTHFAPVLISNKKAQVAFGIKPIPKNIWPQNCYVALLVPR